MLRRIRRAVGALVITTLSTFAFAPIGAAAPGWGSPVEVDRFSTINPPKTFVEIPKNADGEPTLTRVQITSPSTFFFARDIAVNATGDTLDGRVDEDGVSLVFTPTGGTPLASPVDLPISAVFAFARNGNMAARLSPSGDGFITWNAGETPQIGVAYRSRATGAPERGRIVSTPKVASTLRGYALARSGAAAVVWVESVSDTNVQLRAITRSAPDAPWSDPLTIRTSTSPIDAADIAIDDAGNARVAWTESAKLWTSQIRATTSAWEPAVSLGSASRDAQPVMQSSPNGTAVVAWTADDGRAGYSVMVARAAAGGGFAAPARLARNVPFSRVVVDVNDSAAAVVAWVSVVDAAFEGSFRASIGTANGLWSRSQALVAPDIGPENVDEIAIAPSGRAVALTSLFEIEQRLVIRRLVEYGESPQRVPATIETITAPKEVLAGSLVGIDVRVSRGVVRAQLQLQERRGSRWITRRSQRFSGRTASMRAPGGAPGRRTFRMRLVDQGAASLSPAKIVVTRRSAEPTVAFGGTIRGLALTNGIVWALVGDRTSTVARFDSATGRRIGKSLRVGEASVIAAHGGHVWVAEARQLGLIDGTTGRRQATIRVSRSPDDYLLAMTANTAGAWVVVGRFDWSSFTFANLRVIHVDTRGRTVERIPFAFSEAIADVSAIAQAGNAIWIAGRPDDFFSSAPLKVLQINRTSPRGVRIQNVIGTGTLATGGEQVWTLGPTIRRLDPRGGPSGPGIFLPSDDSSSYFLEEAASASVGQDGIWMVRAGVGARRGTRREARFIDSATARYSAPISFGPPTHSSDANIGSSIVAVAGGAWATIPELGLVVRVARRR